jgi:hypothetical protein
MLHRYTYLERDLALADSGERTVNVNVQDPITCLWVEVRNVNGATHNRNNPIHASISDIQLIDGADVLYSLDGYQALALASADLGFLPEQAFSALGGDYQKMQIPIMFGRWLGDTEYSLDPKRFRNLQLRVKWNFGTASATTFTTLTGTLTVIADVMEGAPSPRALVMRKEQYTWTAAVGTEYIDLPTNYPIRGLMYRSYVVAHHLFEVVDQLKMSCDAGKYVPIDLDVEDLVRLETLKQPKLEYRISDHMASGGTFTSYLVEKEDVAMIGEAVNDTVVGYDNYEYGSQIVRIFTAGVANGGTNIGCHVHGYCPFGYLYIPFGDPYDPADWFPAASFGSIRLEARGIHAGDCALVLVQDRPY